MSDLRVRVHTASEPCWCGTPHQPREHEVICTRVFCDARTSNLSALCTRHEEENR